MSGSHFCFSIRRSKWKTGPHRIPSWISDLKVHVITIGNSTRRFCRLFSLDSWGLVSGAHFPCLSSSETDIFESGKLIVGVLQVAAVMFLTRRDLVVCDVSKKVWEVVKCLNSNWTGALSSPRLSCSPLRNVVFLPLLYHCDPTLVQKLISEPCHHQANSVLFGIGVWIQREACHVRGCARMCACVHVSHHPSTLLHFLTSTTIAFCLVQHSACRCGFSHQWLHSHRWPSRASSFAGIPELALLGFPLHGSSPLLTRGTWSREVDARLSDPTRGGVGRKDRDQMLCHLANFPTEYLKSIILPPESAFLIYR
ncbi:uncharacterized protein LOC117286302 [Fukomys damarensis]|uniref:uncharacterized protein LOC117286302 n=1 Tax=Fukomys damarensis TaxID=885580 RepID=UPI0014557626|nr:uncharacterized protein LOC117286302 [Fukomys damarensis]XP_033619948.1 uncharacterized protein LOC117286302 [Fukomys damarensis]XP_033619949.1 uncharacterized protein LOC117286302 [Fukomys damarensis]